MMTVKKLFYIIYLIFLITLVFIAGDANRHIHPFSLENRINLIPGHEKKVLLNTPDLFISGNFRFFLKELFGNLILLLPLGILLNLKKIPEKKIYIILKIFTVSFLIETIQFIMGIGHADIDDLILNTFGGVIGLYLSEWFKKLRIWPITYRILQYNFIKLS